MIFSVGALALLALQSVHAAPSLQKASSRGVKASEHTLALKPVSVKPGSSRELLSRVAKAKNTTHSASLNVVDEGGAYAIEANLGGKNFDVIFDTGSSDLWVFKSGVKCVTGTGHPAAASQCGFGPEFKGNFQGGSIKNETFYIAYADGEQLIGTLGYEDVTIAGVKVKKQEMALVDEAYWEGDGTASGIVGFASKYLTNAFPGTMPSNNTQPLHYNNFITNAVNSKAIDPVFGVVLERNNGSSSVTLGGVPAAFANAKYATTKLQKIEISPHLIEKTQYTYYTITPDGVVLNGESKSTSFAGIVDTGTTLLYLPEAMAEAVNAAFDPPSQYIKAAGVYENDCNAKPPTFGITIGGTTFNLTSEDLLPTGAEAKDPMTGGCVVGVQPSGSTYAILGDRFLVNTVAVFDIGAEEMKFAAHSY